MHRVSEGAEDAPPTERARLRARYFSLIQQHGAEWSKRFREIGVRGPAFGTFIRGFAGRIRIPASMFLKHCEERMALPPETRPKSNRSSAISPRPAISFPHSFTFFCLRCVSDRRSAVNRSRRSPDSTSLHSPSSVFRTSFTHTNLLFRPRRFTWHGGDGGRQTLRQQLTSRFIPWFCQ